MSTARHRVDVIIPTRNRPELTADAIASIHAQTFTEWHLYVVDDASDDDTVARIEQLIADDARITMIRRTTRGGANPARQSAFEVSSAPLVALCDSDDLWEPTKLARQVARWDRAQSESNAVGPVVCWHDTIDLAGRQYGPVHRPRPSRRWHPFVEFNTSTPLMSRSLLDQVGGFAPFTPYPLRTTDHVELFLRLTRHHQLLAVPEVLVHCRRHFGSRNSDRQRTVTAADEAAELARSCDADVRNRPRIRAWLNGWVAGRYLEIGYPRQAAPYLFTAIRADGVGTAIRIIGHYGPLTLRQVLWRKKPPS